MPPAMSCVRVFTNILKIFLKIEIFIVFYTINTKMECNHYEGDLCFECKSGTNVCCGDGKSCDTCNEAFCYNCYDARNVETSRVNCCETNRCNSCRVFPSKYCLNEVVTREFKCPSCSMEIISDAVLLQYFLARYKIDRGAAEERCKKWITKNKN